MAARVLVAAWLRVAAPELISTAFLSTVALLCRTACPTAVWVDTFTLAGAYRRGAAAAAVPTAATGDTGRAVSPATSSDAAPGAATGVPASSVCAATSIRIAPRKRNGRNGRGRQRRQHSHHRRGCSWGRCPHRGCGAGCSLSPAPQEAVHLLCPEAGRCWQRRQRPASARGARPAGAELRACRRRRRRGGRGRAASRWRRHRARGCGRQQQLRRWLDRFRRLCGVCGIRHRDRDRSAGTVWAGRGLKRRAMQESRGHPRPPVAGVGQLAFPHQMA
mmetsp:Transcript_17412/g.41638  ORF Transcript_17412/g.41638 Transcript_17412/m.41638 type:complete len:276 (+) Transcript_17412:985-1812(+)